jgi:hypothetical protein
VSGVFCCTFFGCMVVCLVYSAVLFLAVWQQCAWYILQYFCWRCGSVPGMLCSTVVGGMIVCLVYSAVLFLAVWQCAWYVLQ